MKIRSLLLGIVVLSLASALAQTFSTNPAASLVLGQESFTKNTSVVPPSAASLQTPAGVAISSLSGKLFVLDTFNNRVLRYAAVSSLTSHASAEAVLGQPDFVSKAANAGGSAANNTLNKPFGIFVDSADHLWVGDAANNRVLRFDGASSIATFSAAAIVLGQPDFTTTTSATTTAKMNAPEGLTVDGAGNLWVADMSNNRVLRFANAVSKASGDPADGVLGQTSFLTTLTVPVSAASMNIPSGVTLDSQGTLWVADQGNNRILRFTNAAFVAGPFGASAQSVLGQTDSTSTVSGVSDIKLHGPAAVVIDETGRLWTTDYLNNRLVSFSADASKEIGGVADIVIGQPDFNTNTTTNPPTARGLSGPYTGLFVESTGNVWVSDSLNNRVLRYNPRPILSFKLTPPAATTNARVKLKGSASSTITIAKVEVKVGLKAYRLAHGTKVWTLKPILRPGPNKILIRATDSAGNNSAVLRTVVRRN